MSRLVISLYEDRLLAHGGKPSPRPFEVREVVIENSREAVARFLAKEVHRSVKISYGEDTGSPMEVTARYPRRVSGPFRFWRRAVIVVAEGNPYELRILGMVLGQFTDSGGEEGRSSSGTSLRG